MREMSFDCVKDQGVLSKGNYISGKKRGRSKRRWTLLRKLHRWCETALGNRGRGGGKSKPEGRKLNWEGLRLIVQRTAPMVAAEGIQIWRWSEVFKSRCCDLWGMGCLSSVFRQKLGSEIWAETRMWPSLISLPNLDVRENSSYGSHQLYISRKIFPWQSNFQIKIII